MKKNTLKLAAVSLLAIGTIRIIKLIVSNVNKSDQSAMIEYTRNI